jgi:hypothetical protein
VEPQFAIGDGPTQGKVRCRGVQGPGPHQ